MNGGQQITKNDTFRFGDIKTSLNVQNNLYVQSQIVVGLSAYNNFYTVYQSLCVLQTPSSTPTFDNSTQRATVPTLLIQDNDWIAFIGATLPNGIVNNKAYKMINCVGQTCQLASVTFSNNGSGTMTATKTFNINIGSVYNFIKAF
jgi:hypothetical protein